MAKKTILACSMLENEINHIYNKINCTYPIIWIDKGLHNQPEHLRENLQEIINDLQDQDELLLCFGLCGNGTAGLRSTHARLIIPKFDDCLNMLLCEGKRWYRGLTQPGTIYLTDGWTHDEEGILQQYEKLEEEYDEETRDDIFEMMYAHYDSVSVIDTGCYPLEHVTAYADKVCELLDFERKTTPGYLYILEKLLTGNLDENFILVEPGNTLEDTDFELMSLE